MKHTNSIESYELVKGVWVTDADDIDYNHGKRLDISKYKQFDRIAHKNGYPVQEVLDKLGKNRSWAVCTSWVDPRAKTFCFRVMLNASESEIRTVAFEDACNDYQWKSFKLNDNNTMLMPKK